MKEYSSYKVNILPNDIIVQENKKTEFEKIKIDNFSQIKEISEEINKIIKEDQIKEVSAIIEKLKNYKEYFNQNLLNKEKYEWTSEEFVAYYHYFKFKLFWNYSSVFEKKQVDYYNSAIKIFNRIYEELIKIENVNYYEKICAIVSLYRRLKIDFESKENNVL